MFIHLLEFRVLPGFDAEMAAYLRHQTSDADLSQGMVSCFLGHRLGRQGREHVAVTIWRDAPAMDRGTDRAGIPIYLAPKVSLIGDTISTRYRLVASIGIGGEGARVLRLYRSSIAAGSTEIWERRALVPVGQLVAVKGLLTAAAGMAIDGDRSVEQAGSVRVVVATAWTDWNLLLAATGGRLDGSVPGTQLVDLEGPASIRHFELVA